MPKKMGINSKAVEARERKSAEKKAQNEKKVKEAEDRLWQDDDKHLAKKQSRKVYHILGPKLVYRCTLIFSSLL